MHRLLEKLTPVAGAAYQAKVGLVRDYDNQFDARVDRWHERVQRQSEETIFRACQHTHTPLDYVYQDHTDAVALSRYDVLFCPHLSLMTEERAALLEGFAARGGKVVFGCRSAYKDMHGRCVTGLLPGVLRSLTCADIPEYSFIAPDAERVTIDWQGTQLTAAVFTDLL